MTQGAPPTPEMPPSTTDQAGNGLLEAAAKRRATLAELLAHTGPLDPDHVHDVRVAARRLGEVTRLLAPFMDKPTARAVTATLKTLRRAAGELRDLDVTCEHLSRWKMPAPVRAVAREIAAAMELRRPDLETALRSQMASASVTGAMVILAQIIDQQRLADATAVGDSLRATIESQQRKRTKQLRKAFGRAASKLTAESLHEARIAVKRLRYVVELADAAKLQRGSKTTLRFLKQMQQLLGDHHDVHVILEIVQGHLRDPREKPIGNLAPTWRKWHRLKEREQAKRAATSLMKSYAWMNAP